jgi:peptidyl-prolyl cis-trans isomerase D
MIRILQQDSRIIKGVFIVIIVAAIGAMTVTLIPGIFDNGAANDATVYATVRKPGFLGRLEGSCATVKMDNVNKIAQQQMKQQGYPDMALPYILPRIEQQQLMLAVLKCEADRMGLQAGNADMVSYLKASPLAEYLYPGGNFIGKDKYFDFVQTYYGMSAADFEQEIKDEIETQRMQALVTGGASVSDLEVRQQYMEQGTKVKFDYAVISAADLTKTINPSDADLQVFFKQNAARYATAMPEQRKIAFFVFDSSNLPGGKPAVSDAEVQAYYSTNSAKYATPEQVKTRHILIMVPKGADAKTDAATKAKAEDVLKQVKAGGNFAELAKKYSEDTGSKDQGGELPLYPTSQLDPAYAKAAMALNPGQTSDLVRSQFGYHIIQTEQKQPASMKSLTDAKDSIVSALQAQKSAAAVQNYATQLATEASKSGMQKTVDAHGLHLMTSDYVGRADTIPSLPDSTSLLSAAFSAAKNGPPQPVSTGEGYAVFQVVDVKPAHAPEFADYKSHILDDYRQQKTPELLIQQLQKLADRAKVLNDLHKAAAEMNVPVKTSDLVGRDSQVPDIGALTGAAAVVFALPKGGITGPINEGANGAVAQLTDKQEPSADDIAKNLPTVREKLMEQAQGEMWGVYAGSLMDRYQKSGAIIQSVAQKTPTPLGGKKN